MGKAAMKLLWIVAFFLFLAVPSNATIYYVRQGALCPGNGGTSSEYCSIQNGINRSLGPGDRIRVRNGTYNEVATRNGGANGTLANPIVIEPDENHNPVLSNSACNQSVGIINLLNVDYWTIQGFTINDLGQCTSKHALTAQASTRTSRGIIFSGNKVIRWGGPTQGGPSGTLQTGYATFYFVGGGATSQIFLEDSAMFKNTIAGSLKAAIRDSHTRRSTISGNNISGVRCGLHTVDSYRSAEGIKVAQSGQDGTYSDNFIHDFQSIADCAKVINKPPGRTFFSFAWIYCDTGPQRGKVLRNRLTGTDVTDGNGVHIESRCNDWEVRFNEVIGMNTGLRSQAANCGANLRTKFEHNSISGVRRGIIFRHGTQATARNNAIFVLANTPNSAFDVHPDAIPCGGHTIDGNIYWDGGALAKIGKWGVNKVANFWTWKSQCNCDGSSKVGNPLFTSANDLRLQKGSPAIDGALDLKLFTHSGNAPDVGFKEFPFSPAAPSTRF
jgi:hypothetical protein